MELKGEIAGRYVRIVAIIALLLGLADAARLVGVNSGAVSPLATLGPAGFTYLAIFCLARLFAAVGLWIRASWGAALLIGATAAELVLSLTGNPDVQMDVIGFALRLVLLIAISVVLLLTLRMRRAQD